MPAERPPPLPAAPAVLRRASGPEAVLFSRRAGGWLGRPRKVFVLTAEAPAPLDTKRWVWISWALFRSTHPRRERRATAAHDSLRVLSRAGASKTPQRLASSPCLRTPRPRSSSRAAGSSARRPRAALAPRTVRSPRRLLCSVEEGAPQRHTVVWGRLCPPRASPRLAVARCGPRLAPWHEGSACGGYSRAPRALGRSRVRTSPTADLPQVVRARCGALVAVACGCGKARGGAGASHVPVTEERGVARRAARGKWAAFGSRAARWGYATFYILLSPG